MATETKVTHTPGPWTEPRQNARLREALGDCCDGLRKIGKHLIKNDCFNAGQDLNPCPC